MDINIKYIIITSIIALIIIYIKVYCDNNSRYIIPKKNIENLPNPDNYTLTYTVYNDCAICNNFIPVWNLIQSKYGCSGLKFILKIRSNYSGKLSNISIISSQNPVPIIRTDLMEKVALKNFIHGLNYNKSGCYIN